METLALIQSPDYLHFVMLFQYRWGIESYSRWMFSIHRAERENQCWSAIVVLHSSSALVGNAYRGGLSSMSFIYTVAKARHVSAQRYVQPLLRECVFTLLVWFLHATQHTWMLGISHNSSSVPKQGEGESAVPFHPRNEKRNDLTWEIMEQQWENQNESSELLNSVPYTLLGCQDRELPWLGKIWELQLFSDRTTWRWQRRIRWNWITETSVSSLTMY